MKPRVKFLTLAACLALAQVANAASGGIVSARPSSFEPSKPTVVTVVVENTGPTADFLVLYADSVCDPFNGVPPGWSIRPLKVWDLNLWGDYNPLIEAGAKYEATFEVIPPANGGRGTFIWKLQDDGLFCNNPLLDTLEQAVTASSPGPVISGVSPNPVIGANCAQAFKITGTGFARGCSVTLRDLTTGGVFPDRAIIAFATTEILIHPNFTTSAHDWTVEVINPGGASSGQFDFQVVAPVGQAEPSGSIWFPSCNFSNRPETTAIDAIVIHTVEGNYESGLSTLTDASAPLNERVSAHYLITPSGDIFELVALDKSAWHATYYNDRSIGIEMAGFANDPITWNVQNLGALEDLVAYLVKRFGIPVVHPAGDASSYPNCLFTDSGLIAHSQIQPGCNWYATKSDPGPHFPWDAFVQNVRRKILENGTLEQSLSAASSSASMWNKTLSWRDANFASTASGEQRPVREGELVVENARQDSNERYVVTRAFLVFHIAGLPAGLRVTGATLKLHVTDIVLADRRIPFRHDEQSYIQVVQATPQDPARLQTSDFGRVDRGALWSDKHYFETFGVGQSLSIPLSEELLPRLENGSTVVLALMNGHELENVNHFSQVNVHNQQVQFGGPTSEIPPELVLNLAPVTPPVTRRLERLKLVGAATIRSGEVSPFQCLAVFSDGTSAEVTEMSQWTVVSPTVPGTFFHRNQLHAGPTATAATVAVQAKFRERSTTVQATQQVTILPSLAVDFSFEHFRSGAALIQYRLMASVSGEQTPGSFTWDLDADGDFDDRSGQEIIADFPAPGTYRVGVRAADALARAVTGYRLVAVERQQADEPDGPPAMDLEEGSFLNSSGAPFVPLAERKDDGLLVIVHGMCDSANEPWVTQMGQAVERGLPAGQVPDIALYDWHESANPTRYLLTEGPNSVSDCSRFEVFFNVITSVIRVAGVAEGRDLANRIWNLVREGSVPADARIHLIGHSAGGFVIGECALVLKQAGINVAQVTMLDTPHPLRKHVTGSVERGRLDRYISSVAGLFAPEVDALGCNPALAATFATLGLSKAALVSLLSCVIAVPQNDHYYRYQLTSTAALLASIVSLESSHTKAYEWYTETIQQGREEGFWYSPWRGKPFPSQSPGLASALETPGESPRSLSLTNFQTFGTVTSDADKFSLHEGGNSGIYQVLALPFGVQSVRFHYRFTAGGDGDFLSVHWGTNQALFIGLDNAMSREMSLDAEVPLAEYAGETNTLVFKLVSRGQTNAVLSLADIELTLNDDPDGDRLPSEQEVALNSSPLAYDTDGDGLNDSEEVNLYHTKPALADGDGDGASDPAELRAGTDPNNQSSVLQIRSARLNSDNTVTLEWPGMSGRSYRVIRTPSLDLSLISVRTNGLPAQLPTTSFSEPLPANATTFYWVEVE